MKIIYSFCGVFLTFAILGEAQILPEPLTPYVNHASVCYGPGTHGQRFRPSCPDSTTVIAVQGVRVGAKTLESGCPSSVTEWTNHTGSYLVDHMDFTKIVNESGCCFPDVERDCISDYSYLDSGIEYKYHKGSSGYSTSQSDFEVAWQRTTCNHSSDYLIGTNYMFMDYSCIERTRIGDLCSDNTYTVTDGAFYLYNTGYPESVSAAIGVCECRVQSNASAINFYSIDTRLETYEDNCEQTLNATDSNGTIFWDCQSSPIFNVTKETKFGELKLTFKNNMAVDGGYVWIGVFAGTQGALLIDCTVAEKDIQTTSSYKPSYTDSQTYSRSISSTMLTTKETNSNKSEDSTVSTRIQSTWTETTSQAETSTNEITESAFPSNISTEKSTETTFSSYISTERISTEGSTEITTTDYISTKENMETTSTDHESTENSIDTTSSGHMSTKISTQTVSSSHEPTENTETTSSERMLTTSTIQASSLKQSYSTWHSISQTKTSALPKTGSTDDNLTTNYQTQTVSVPLTVAAINEIITIPTVEKFFTKETRFTEMIGVLCGTLVIVLILVISLGYCFVWRKLLRLLNNRISPGQDELNKIEQGISQTSNTGSTVSPTSSSYVSVRDASIFSENQEETNAQPSNSGNKGNGEETDNREERNIQPSWHESTRNEEETESQGQVSSERSDDCDVDSGNVEEIEHQEESNIASSNDEITVSPSSSFISVLSENLEESKVPTSNPQILNAGSNTNSSANTYVQTEAWTIEKSDKHIRKGKSDSKHKKSKRKKNKKKKETIVYVLI